MHRDDGGQVIPIMLVVVAVLMVAAFWLFETGLAGTLRVGGQSAADAAALAAAAQLQNEAIGLIRNPPPSGPPSGVYDRTRQAARDYAARNDARLRRFDAHVREFRVEVDTERQLQGETADRLGVSGTRGEAISRSRLTINWRLGPPAPRTRPPPLPETDIEAIASRNGYDVEDVPPDSALRSPFTCLPGPDVVNLNDRMHDVIVRLEVDETHGIGGALSLADGYRTQACQGWGQAFSGIHSPLNYGDGFRTTSGQTAAVAARMAQVGLCRPFTNDPNLFAHRLSDACDGRTGNLGPGQAYGGNLGNLVEFEVELIPDEGPLGASSP